MFKERLSARKRINNLLAGLVSLMIVLSITATSSWGTFYYVAKTGTNNNPGTEALPFLTINKAASVINPGDTVYIKRGNYPEVVDITRSGTPGNEITFTAYPGDEKLAIVDGATLTATWWNQM